MKITGAMTAIATPMSEDGAVDYSYLNKLIDYQIDNSISAIVAVGTTGESATIDFDEHVSLIEYFVKYIDGRVKVIAGTGANSTIEALELTKSAKDAGADDAGGVQSPASGTVAKVIAEVSRETVDPRAVCLSRLEKYQGEPDWCIGGSKARAAPKELAGRFLSCGSTSRRSPPPCPSTAKWTRRALRMSVATHGQEGPGGRDTTLYFILEFEARRRVALLGSDPLAGLGSSFGGSAGLAAPQIAQAKLAAAASASRAA